MALRRPQATCLAFVVTCSAFIASEVAWEAMKRQNPSLPIEVGVLECGS